MDVDVRWLGSVYDGRVFVMFRINKLLKAEKFFLLYKEILLGYGKVLVILLGDFVYFLFFYCTKEFFNLYNNEEVIFNNILWGVRNFIECVFGRLKVSW